MLLFGDLLFRRLCTTPDELRRTQCTESDIVNAVGNWASAQSRVGDSPDWFRVLPGQPLAAFTLSVLRHRLRPSDAAGSFDPDGTIRSA
jgi:hypothetical protein